MINKLKLGIFALSLLVVLSMASDANAQAVNLTSSVSVTLGGNNYTIDSGAGATTIVVGSASVTLTVPAASTAVFASLDRFDLDNNGGLTQTCTDAFSYLTITGAATVVITPDTSNVCEGGGGGGGGGGGSGNDDDDEEEEDAEDADADDDSDSDSDSDDSAGASSYNFGTVTVRQGVVGDAVKEWQRFLNATMNASLVVDGVCGPRCVAAIKAFQTSEGLVADGVAGALSRAAADTIPATSSDSTPARGLCPNGKTIASNCASAPAPAANANADTAGTGSYNFGTATVRQGAQGTFASEVQKFLNAEFNAGLIVDGNFGPMSTTALQAWQASVGLTADGVWGAASRAKALAD